MHRPWIALLAAAALAPAAASDADMRSDACRDAVAALQAREAQLANAASAPRAAADAKPRTATDRTWQALRVRAAKTCLGGKADAPLTPPQSATVPIAVPPVLPPNSGPRAATAAAPSPTFELRPPPATVNRCDAGGCWMSDGTRLPQVGRNPQDPMVRCTPQGAMVMCQ